MRRGAPFIILLERVILAIEYTCIPVWLSYTINTYNCSIFAARIIAEVSTASSSIVRIGETGIVRIPFNGRNFIICYGSGALSMDIASSEYAGVNFRFLGSISFQGDYNFRTFRLFSITREIHRTVYTCKTDLAVSPSIDESFFLTDNFSKLLYPDLTL